MRKKISKIKRVFTLCLIFLFSINTFATSVNNNDGSAFITKAEFDALKSSFQAQIDTYNQNLDIKIDEAIASYLSGITIKRTIEEKCLLGNLYSKIESYGKDYKHNPHKVIGKLTIQYQILRGWISTNYTAAVGQIFDNKLTSNATPTYDWINLFSVLDKDSDGTYNFQGRKKITWQGSVNGFNFNTGYIDSSSYLGAIGSTVAWAGTYGLTYATAISKNPIKTFNFVNLPQSKTQYADPAGYASRTSTGALDLSDGKLIDWNDSDRPSRDGWILLGFATIDKSMPIQTGVANIQIYQIDADTTKRAIMFYNDNANVYEPFSASDIYPTCSFTFSSTNSFSKVTNPKWNWDSYRKLTMTGTSRTLAESTTIPTGTITSSTKQYQLGDPLLPECYDVDISKIKYNDFTTVKKDGVSTSDASSSNNVGRFALNVGLPLFKVSTDGVLSIPFNFDSAASKSYKVWLKHGPFPVDKTTIAKVTCLAPKETVPQNADGSFTLTFNATGDPITLDFDVKKDDLIYIYFTEDGKEGGGIFNVPKTCELVFSN